MDYVKKRQVVHALSRRRRPGACAAKRFAEGKTLPHTEPQRGVSERNRRKAAALSAEMGGFIPPEDLKTKGPQTNEVCLGVDDLKPFDAMEFAEALI